MSSNPTRNVERNTNLVWAELFVDELARCGVQDVCIAPGSRSTPLAFAFFANPHIRIYQHLDERSAGFFALGIALGKQHPVALLCTSGTAAANFYPAIIEAHMSQVPLLILTADRPHELRHSGANQTIDQIKMFGDHVLWSIDMAIPEKNPSEVVLRNLRATAARAVAMAEGLRKGPVHLNFPFRKPLEPSVDEDWMAAGLHLDRVADRQPLTRMVRAKMRPLPQEIAWLADLITRESEGIIVCGPQCPGGDFPRAVVNLAVKSGYPILADSLSGVRFGPQVAHGPVCGAYETFLNPQLPIPHPQVVLRFGAVPTSARLGSFLGANSIELNIHIRESGIWADDNHRTTHFLQMNEEEVCDLLASGLPPAPDLDWLDVWMRLESECWAQLDVGLADAHFDGAYVRDLIEQLPDGSVLFAGNSLPIRHVDQFGRPNKKHLHVFANRGASGIDGNISTGLGLAASTRRPAAILVGDITFYHDSNGLLALRHVDSQPVTIIVLNNYGGGIFQRLPVAQFAAPFEALFQAPHGLDLASIADTYGLNYADLAYWRSSPALLTQQDVGARAQLLEIRTDAAHDNQARLDLEARVITNLR